MTATSSNLPRFDHPPVIETVLGVFFRPLRKLNSVEQGIFWNEVLRGDFPNYELRSPVEEIAERFENDSGFLRSGVRWQVTSEPDTPRLWARSPSEEHILQVQRNALLANWLRRKENHYHPFSERLADFLNRLNQFVDFTRLAKIDEELQYSSCTITYINHIHLREGEQWMEAAARVLNCWSKPSTGPLPPVDRGQFQFSISFPEENGRLHITVTPALGEQNQGLLLQVELTARLMLPKQSSIEGVGCGLQTAHDWVVHGFAGLTRPEMHEEWGRLP